MMHGKSNAAAQEQPAAPESGESDVRRRRDPAALARLDELFRSAPPEWQEVFAELDRRDPKMR
ncbi:hypothetical protein [Sorangium sp. So ce131]|uniref:hypothetical protein n=1 Tax=Sorangium sp. So ce131 TaxID=3133282 RepID=UPI003F61D4F3